MKKKPFGSISPTPFDPTYRPRRWRFWPKLAPEDWDLIEQIRQNGKIEQTRTDLVTEFLRGDRYGPYAKTLSMREAEYYSRNADRKNSIWFNDEMLSWWEDRWITDDTNQAERDVVSRLTKEERERRRQQQLKDRAEERKTWEREADLWKRQQAWLEEQRRIRMERWTAEEREWEDLEERERQEQRHQRVRAASMEYEERKSNQRRLWRDFIATSRAIRKVTSHDRYPRYRRHSRKNA